MKKDLVLILLVVTLPFTIFSQSQHDIETKGIEFTRNGQPFHFTGLSFFNAIYNPTFNKDAASRKAWLTKFKSNGINVLRIWAQWDNTLGFVDACSTCTLYESNGTLRAQPLNTLKIIIQAAAELDMVVLFVLFQRESWNDNIRLSNDASEKAVRAVSEQLKPYRNVILQVWNEFDHRTIEYTKIIKSVDARRLVTNAPGYAGFLGTDAENAVLDFLSPHTTRDDDRHWEIAAKEIAYLIERHRKPVVDDEPARWDSAYIGGVKNPISPYDHVLHIYNVWKVGGHIIYHHALFQKKDYGNRVPPHGIPDPEFSPYDKIVFDFLSRRDRYIGPLKTSH